MSQPEQGTDTPRTALPRPAGRYEAYLDSRPDETSRYNPAAEYGDDDWREPASDAGAAAPTAWLEDNTAPTSGWSPRPSTEVEDALDAAREQAVHSDWAHDHDPHAWAEYRRLEALDHLAPLPERDALDDEPHSEDHLTGDDGRGPFPDSQGRWWPSTGAWAAGTCDPAKALDTAHLDDPERLRQRIEDLRAELAHRDTPTRETGLGAGSNDEDEQRRDQLARWHDDDVRREALGIRAEVGDLRD